MRSAVTPPTQTKHYRGVFYNKTHTEARLPWAGALQIQAFTESLNEDVFAVWIVILISWLLLHLHNSVSLLKHTDITLELLSTFRLLAQQTDRNFTKTKLGDKEGNTTTAVVIVACYVGNKRALNWGLIV